MKHTVDVTLSIKDVGAVLKDTYSQMGQAVAQARTDLLNEISPEEEYSYTDILEIVNIAVEATVDAVNGFLPRFNDEDSLAGAYFQAINT